MPGLSAQEELILLKKRARRRLVGAIVLVTVATAVLWNVVGRMPEQKMTPESIAITGESSQAAATEPPLPASAPAVAEAPASAPTEIVAALPDATPPLAPAAQEPVKPVPPAQPLPKPAEPAKPPKAEVKENKKPEPKSEAKPARQPDPAAILEGRDGHEDAAPRAAAPSSGSYLIQLAALSDPQKVEALRGKLAAAGVNASFTKVQTSKGEVTRVRVGSFASRTEAEAALARLAKAGVNGIIVSK